MCVPPKTWNAREPLLVAINLVNRILYSTEASLLAKEAIASFGAKSRLGYSGENLNARKVYVPTVREICFFLIHVYFTYTIIRYIMSQKNSRYSEFSRGKLEFNSRV